MLISINKEGFIMVNKLRELRNEKGLTLRAAVKELSEKTNLSISPDSLAKYERGVREPKLAVWQKLADFYNVSILYIQGISPYKSASDVRDNQKTHNKRLDIMRFFQEQLGSETYENDADLQELENALFEEDRQLNTESMRYTNYDDLLAYSNLARILFSPAFFADTNNKYNDKVKKQCIKILKNNSKENASIADGMQYSNNIFLLKNLFEVILDAQDGDQEAIKIKNNISDELHKRDSF
ncbi:helix-turn-helix domain-containing protein [Lactiplantibacillus plantarum]|nr:helix-turn-helix domain-containing protein [Lactiplantibacillus plantarum]QAR77345.1 helix-turn-helix domain-containing protein [Lactiplantibacillus plantarum]QAS28527.1 helix-turn-helix domain-containing protein [Lactiplantibacillus plantarum]QBA78639.1 helix-turn-helix domain-containing protein [Lactiplantibacillus plantarum]RWZ44927.1 helix-turn-helix domain-containing protein [Lactiplantibacillus plantarum]